MSGPQLPSASFASALAPYADELVSLRRDLHAHPELGRRETRTTRVWVAPVYRNVCDRVWVAPVTQTVCERVWVPDRYEERQVVRYEGWWRRVECVRVLVQPAHYEEQSRQVEVAPGHWQEVQRQELVSAGHWEYRQDRIACADPYPASTHVRLQFGGR